MNRILTGNWYLKQRFFDSFTVMVQVSYSNYGEDPEYTIYEKAKREDLVELNIKVA